MTTITFAAPVDWSNSVLDDYSINIEEVPNLSELIERDFGFSTSNDYLVRYTENQLVNEGVIYGPEWSEASDAENLTRDGEVRSFFQALDNGEELCIVFRNKDNYKLSPRAIHTFAVVFDLNEDGIYNEENDWAKVFHAPWSTAPDTVLMPGQTVNSLTSEDGTCSKPLLISPTGEIIYQEVQYSAWEEDPCDSGIEGLAYGYDRENEYNYGGVSDDSLYWAGEFCVSYEELGIIPLTGNEPPPERILHTIFAVNYESTSETYDPESGGYTCPENNSHPDNLEWGQFYGLIT